MNHEELWIMVDVETSGPLYATHSLTELGAAVGSRSPGVIDTIEGLMAPIAPAVERSRRSFERASREGASPAEGMRRFQSWCERYTGDRHRFVARPAAFDWPWVVYYAWTYLGANPFGFKAVCASSWFDAKGLRFDPKLSHLAVDDAKVQLEHFFARGFRSSLAQDHVR